MSGASITAEPSPGAAPPQPKGRPWRSYAVAFGFLAPTLFFLGIWIVYPTIRTFIRSFFDRTGDEFVWFDNYQTIFTSDVLLTAVKNNAIWVLVVPALVTGIGLIFAVLTERIAWSVAFKTAVFMPMAISAFAAGVTWRIMYQQDPDQGAVNAAIGAVKDTVDPPGVLSDAAPSTEALVGTPGRRPHAGRAGRAGRSRSARAHAYLGGRGSRRFAAGRPAGGAFRRDHRRRLARLQARWRQARRGRERGDRPPRGNRRAPKRRTAPRSPRRRPRPTAPSRSTTSSRGATTSPSARRRSRSRSTASPGSASA